MSKQVRGGRGSEKAGTCGPCGHRHHMMCDTKHVHCHAKSSTHIVNEGQAVLQMNTMDENEYESDIQDVWNRETG